MFRRRSRCVLAAIWVALGALAGASAQEVELRAGKVRPNPTVEEAELRAGTVRQNPKDGLPYVWIPPGVFWMGCVPNDSDCQEREKPRHRVAVPEGFWIGRTEVTVAAYEKFASSSGRSMPPAPNFDPKWEHKKNPIVQVTWQEAQGYCEWAGGRLPSEAEWEYAARGGAQESKYPWGDEIDAERANYRAPGPRKVPAYTSPVGSYPPNQLGLYDVAGNVWEWVADVYDKEDYSRYGSSRPAPAPDSPRVVRGGSWWSQPSLLRLSHRFGFNPDDRLFNVGMRCVWLQGQIGPEPAPVLSGGSGGHTESTSIAEPPPSWADAGESRTTTTTKPPVQQQPKPAPSPAAPSRPAAKPPAASLYLQVAAVRVRARAQKLVDELKDRGYAAQVDDQGEDGWYRVVLGPFADLEAARGLRDRLVQDGFEVIVRRPPGP